MIILQKRKIFAPARAKNPKLPSRQPTHLSLSYAEHTMHKNIVPYFLTFAELLTGFEHLSFVKPFYNHGLVTNRCQ